MRIDGSVIRGDQRGRTIGFPTANLHRQRAAASARRHATTTTIAGIVHRSVTNIGVRPTVDTSGRATVETHIFDIERDLCGVSIRVGFVQRLRDERAFASVELPRADCHRLHPRARIVRSAFTIESSAVADHEFMFALDLSDQAL